MLNLDKSVSQNAHRICLGGDDKSGLGSRDIRPVLRVPGQVVLDVKVCKRHILGSPEIQQCVIKTEVNKGESGHHWIDFS